MKYSDGTNETAGTLIRSGRLKLMSEYDYSRFDIN